MSKQIFVNLPVKDLKRSVAFFTELGYKFDSQFTDDNATCMIISDVIFVMLLVEPFFKTFTKKEIADSIKSTEVILCLSADSKEEVDSLVSKAVKAGATAANEKQDHGWMYGHGFEDLDGHLWEVMYMDKSEMDKEKNKLS
ncbi:MAG: VOC family protein [Ignavibacteria bacterium]